MSVGAVFPEGVFPAGLFTGFPQVTISPTIPTYRGKHVIGSTYYALNASTRQIALTSPYNVVTIENVLTIRDLNTGDLIYDSRNPTKHPITVVSGEEACIITYSYDSVGIADTDKIQIFVHMG